MDINDVELSILASISKGYTAGQILEIIHKVIDIKHENNICTSNDFIPLLGIKSPIFIDEENKIKVKKSKNIFQYIISKFIELVF
jgi:hypothetical protein